MIMKSKSTLILVGMFFAVFSAAASARDHVSFSLSVGVPAYTYAAPAPVYYPPPQVVYYPPAPVYYAPPAAVYYAPVPLAPRFVGGRWHGHRGHGHRW
jgi:hypothetical protein